MAVQGAQVDVSTTAVALNSADTDGTMGQTLLVRNLDTDDLTLPCSAPAAIWDRVLTAGELARLPTLMGV